jgi:Lon-like ATP-dependent protease
LESIPVKQSLAMTGSLSVRGEVLPVGGLTSKVQAALAAGFKEVLIPQANKDDVILPKSELKKIKIIPVSTLADVLENAFVKGSRKTKLLKNLKKILDLKLSLPKLPASA